jgi:NAD(P)-dependent dehydrogenase (short-subunit alcohol dehydrogenase family)
MKQHQTSKEALSGKKIVIIGGSAGIGLATAKSAAAKGAQIIIASGNQQRINDALNELPEGSKGFQLDVRDENAVEDFFKKTGEIDHLVFTAGENLLLGNISDLSVETARNFFNIRYWGAFTAVKYAAPFLSKAGSVVFTGGIAANRPNAGWSIGASICAAMEGFTKAMAMELAPIRVNIVSPGIVETDLWSNIPTADRTNMYAEMANRLPVKRTGNPDDIAKAYIYFMEQEYGTGQTLIADGGGSFV